MAVKNELILEDVLTIHDGDVGVGMRVVVSALDLIEMKPHTDDGEIKDLRIYLIFTPEQIKQIHQLMQVWIPEEKETHSHAPD